MENIEIIKKNCEEFAKNSKSIDVLRRANGKNHYKKIAELVDLHPTNTSGLLKKAEKLGLAKRVEAGIYKKIPGVLGYMPKHNSLKGGLRKTTRDLVRKVDRVKKIKQKVNFPPSLVIQTKIISSVDRMVIAYQNLYAVENSLRELIRNVFKGENNWWKIRVPPDVQTTVTKNIADMPYHASSRGDELEYTHLGQLKEIIIRGKNWGLFLPYLNTKDKGDFSVTIDKAIPSRNAIGHCIPLKTDQLKIVDVRLRDILNMIK